LTVVIDGRQQLRYGAAVPSRPAAPTAEPSAVGVREVRRLETRARLFDAAIAEIGRRGLAGADVTAIANAAGVVRGTFYFHFPTKEHVLVELQLNEEARMVGELSDEHISTDDLETVLTLMVRQVLDAESRLGPRVFRDMLGLHFSSSRPAEDQLAEHPVAQFLVDVIARAQQTGKVRVDVDAGELAVFFGTGLFALLATGGHDTAGSAAILRRYVTTIVKGMEMR
jgi:AcrR family transcriptional regulator